MRSLAIWLLMSWLLALPVLADVIEVKPEQFQPGAGANHLPTGQGTSVVRLATTKSAGTVMSVAQSLEPGRYRVWFPVAASAYAQIKRNGAAHVPTVVISASGDRISASLALDGTQLPASPPLDAGTNSTTPTDPDAEATDAGDIEWNPVFTSIPLDVRVPRAMRATFSVAVQDWAGGYVCMGPLRIERSDPGVFVTRVFPKKLMYEPGETGSAAATLLNYTDAPQEVTLAPVLVQELARETPLAAMTVTVPAGAEQTVTIPFTAPKTEYGCELRVTATVKGFVPDSNGDVFTVTSNFEQVSIGGFVSSVSGMTGSGTPETARAAADFLRQRYANKLEKIFWPPDDWGNMAPPMEEWISGQTARHEKKSVIKAFIDAAHDQGIKVTTYGKHAAGGTAGWELLRARPDWFYTNGFGVPIGPFFSSDLRTWDDIAYHNAHYKEYWTTYWTGPSPDFRRVDVLDWGIDNVLASTAMFGWDGIRFDGHWTAGNDALSAWNARRMKERVWAKYPTFRFGFNYSTTPGYEYVYVGDGVKRGFQHELEENVTGGMFMNEGVRGSDYSYSGKPQGSWKAFAALEIPAADKLHRIGGNYEWCWFPDDPGPARNMYYKSIIGTIAGAHPAYGMGELNWNRFLTRWCGFVYDPTAWLVPAKDTVEVTAAAPLWWNDFVKERIPDAGTRQVIVHLVNPPASDAVCDNTPLPAPVTNVVAKVAIPPGQQLIRAMAIAPNGLPEAVPLPITRNGGWGAATVPVVFQWSIVVFEFAGQFTVPAPRPRFIREPDPAQVEAGRTLNGVPQAVDPLRPNLQQTGKTVYPLARDGNVAAVRNVLLPGAGRYRATFTVKLDTNTPAAKTDAGWCQVTLEGTDGRKPVYFSRVLAPKEFTVAGAAQEFACEFDYCWQGVLHLQATFTCPNGGNAAGFEAVALECLERYTDAQLGDKLPKAIPPVDFAIGGPPGLDILWVRGLYDPLYRVDEALKAFPDAQVTNVESWEGGVNPKRCAFNWDTFRKYDLVILGDVLAPSDVTMRLALREFVNRGGGLIILGGPYAFGQGGYCGTPQEAQMPVALRNGKDLEALAAPQALAPAPGATLLAGVTPEQWRAAPMLYWRHRVTMKPNGKAQLLAGTEPVLSTSTAGAGRLVVFTGTPLGGPGLDNDRRGVKIVTPFDGQTPWWQWSGWPVIMANTLRWAGGDAVTRRHPARDDTPAKDPNTPGDPE